MALSLFATQQDRFAQATLQLREAAEQAEDSETSLLYSRAWAAAFTAGRHLLLAELNSQSAEAARTTAAGFGRQRVAAEAARVRASELDAIARRHRAAADKAAEQAYQLEAEAKGEKPDEQPQAQRGGQPVPRQAPAAGRQQPAQPPRGQQASPQQRQPARPPQSQQQPARPSQPQQAPRRTDQPAGAAGQPLVRQTQPVAAPAQPMQASPAAVGPQTANAPPGGAIVPPRPTGGDDGDGE